MVNGISRRHFLAGSALTAAGLTSGALLAGRTAKAAAAKVVALAPALKAKGIRVKGVRIDSGNLAEHARKVRRILDDGGLREAQILASGNLDEWRIKELMDGGAPIDSFAVGTAMTTS